MISPKESCVPVAVTMLCNGSGPPPGFVRRSRPVFAEWIRKYDCFPVQYHEQTEDPDMVWVWIPKEVNWAYERGDAFGKRHIIHEKRWCEARVKITGLQRGRSMWFKVELYFTVVSSIHSVMQAYPSRKLQYARLKRGNESGVLVRRVA